MGLMSAALTERRKASDFMVAEWDHRYCREVVPVKNSSGANLDFQPGEILDFVTPNYEQTGVANAGDAILIQDIGVLANNAIVNALVLMRGPAIINTDRVFVQAAATKATVLASLATSMNPKVKFITEPTIKQTGPLV